MDHIRRAAPDCGFPIPRRTSELTPQLTTEQVAEPPQPSSTDDSDPFAVSRLRVTLRPDGESGILLEQGMRIVVGRAPESPIAHLCGDNVSRHHAAIYFREDAAYIEDTGSANGTFVDGRKLAPRQPERLTSTASVQLGTDPPLAMTIDVESIP